MKYLLLSLGDVGLHNLVWIAALLAALLGVLVVALLTS